MYKLQNIKNFYNNQFGNLTVIIDENDGNPWFIGKEVSEMLGYAITRKAIKDHVDEEDKKVINKNSDPKWIGIISAGNPNIILINESGLYSLILKSKLESAKQFKRWVTSKVLPSIRKTGSYSIAPKKELSTLEVLKLATKEIEKLQVQNKQLENSIEKLQVQNKQLENSNEVLKQENKEYSNFISNSEEEMGVNQIASFVARPNGDAVSGIFINRILLREKLIKKNGNQFKSNGYLPTVKAKKEFYNFKYVEINHNPNFKKPQITYTRKGMIYIISKILPKYNIIPNEKFKELSNSAELQGEFNYVRFIEIEEELF